jgi:hypothetical protein
MFSPMMKVRFIWIILGTQCGSHPEFPGQQHDGKFVSSPAILGTKTRYIFGLRIKSRNQLASKNSYSSLISELCPGIEDNQNPTILF